jgi:tRNA modification GTPase
VRISGPAVPQLERRLVKTRSPLRARYATRATILDEWGAPLDEGLAIRFMAPQSYTGEEMLELHVHGSPVVAREVVRAWLACGARVAGPGEFTQRAFFNDKLDLHAAAAVADVVDAETAAAARAASANLGGGLTEEVRRLRASLAKILEELAAAIDFPEEVAEPNRADLALRLRAIRESLEHLRHDGELGRLIREGLQVAIVGPPNAGKSSLLNALLGSDRAIVSETPGTTRDTIEETVVVDGVPVRLIDTAGIRAHADRLESEGIQRTQQALRQARIALVVIDGSRPLHAGDRRLLEETSHRDRIILFNKADLGIAGVPQPLDPNAVVGSAFSPETLDALRRQIADAGWGGERIDLARPHLAALHEFESVNAALHSLQRVDETLQRNEPLDFVAPELQRAFSSLGQVSERVAAEEILDRIFARFCIGK